jgi:hypothetical protein
MVRTRLAASDLSDGSTASHFKSFYLGVLAVKTSPPKRANVVWNCYIRRACCGSNAGSPQGRRGDAASHRHFHQFCQYSNRRRIFLSGGG